MKAAPSGEFRELIRSELLDRCRQNPRYSLRAFAKQLGLAPSTLSMVLAGQRGLGPVMIKKLSAKLGLSAQEAAVYAERNSATAEETSAYRQLAFDHFRVIADWHHYALLELVSVRGFQADSAWVARALGISKSEVEAAVKRLQRLEMLSVENGVWRDLSENVTNLDNPLIASSRRKHQAQILAKAAEALQKTPIDRRDQSSMVMAIDSRKLPEAQKRLTKFRRQLTTYLQKGERDGVYALSLSLFPLTSKIHGESS